MTAKAYSNDVDDLAKGLNDLSITVKNSPIKKKDSLTIMNINYAEFRHFKEELLNVIKYYGPDIITLQETILTFTKDNITKKGVEIGKNYAFERCEYNEYQNDSSFNAIIYNKNKFNKVAELDNFENVIKNKDEYNNDNFREIRTKRLAIIYCPENKENPCGLLVASFHNFKNGKSEEEKFKCMSLVCNYLNDLKILIQENDKTIKGKVALIVGTDSNIENFTNYTAIVDELRDINLRILGESRQFNIKVGWKIKSKQNFCFFIVGRDNIEFSPAEIINEDMVNNIKSNIDPNSNNTQNEDFKRKLINLIDNKIVFLTVNQSIRNDINYTFLKPLAEYSGLIQHPILIIMAKLCPDDDNNLATIMNINYAKFRHFKEELLNVIKYYKPDIITLQEANSLFIKMLKKEEGKINKNYNIQKCENNEYQSSFNAIIYNENKFNKVAELDNFENVIKNKDEYNNDDFREIRTKRLAIIYCPENKENPCGLLVASFHNFNNISKEKFKSKISLVCNYLNDLKIRIQKETQVKVALIIGIDSHIENLEDYKDTLVQLQDINLKIFGQSRKCKFGLKKNLLQFFCYFIVGSDNIEFSPAEIINEDMVNNIKSSIDPNSNNTQNEDFKRKLINLIDNKIVFLTVNQFDVNDINYTFLKPPAVHSGLIQHPILISEVEIRSTLTDNKQSNVNVEVSKKRTEEEIEKEKEKDKKDKEAEKVGDETEKKN